MNIQTKVLNNIKSIVKEIETTNKDISFYLNSAPKSVPSPYVVFRLEDMIDTSPTYNFTLKFMCWDDRNKSSENVLKIADIINDKLNKKQLVFDDMGIHSVLNISQNIPSEFLTDKQCVELQFDITIYERKM